MELKHKIYLYLILLDRLLIVPYGIETSFARAAFASLGLLIVPYGIETP